jgi:predicted GNAT superfamily acetyltransferase
LGLKHYLTADVQVINPTDIDKRGVPDPNRISSADIAKSYLHSPILLLEIPADINSLKAVDPDLALKWRLHVRELFNELFNSGYLVTDFIYEPGEIPRSYYVLSHGESTL